MNIELAHTFLKVVALGSLARASEVLHVTHSTVTMRINSLENLLGHRLLIRDRSGAKMTAEGVRFHHFAEEMVRLWQTTQLSMSLGPGFDGILSVGADDTLWSDFMLSWVTKTRRQRPSIALRCESGRSPYLVDRLFGGWLDIALVYEAQLRSGFVVEPLFDDPLVMVSTVQRGRKEKWDPDLIYVYWDEGVRRQELQLWGDYHETPHLSVDSLAIGLKLLREFGGSMRVPQRLLDEGNLPCPLYRVPDIPIMERTVRVMYSEEALKKIAPDIPAAGIRHSLMAVLSGEETIWPEDAKPRRRKPRRS